MVRAFNFHGRECHVWGVAINGGTPAGWFRMFYNGQSENEIDDNWG